jgi:hypothetical protein
MSDLGTTIDAVRRGYANTPKAVTMAFVVLFLVGSVLMALAFGAEYKHDVYMRDYGIKTDATITNKYSHRGRSYKHYYIDYAYQPIETTSGGGLIASKGHGVSYEDFHRYGVGEHIATKYNPRNPQDTQLDVEGYQSNERLALNPALKFTLIDVVAGVIFFSVWSFVVSRFANFSGSVGNIMPPR